MTYILWPAVAIMKPRLGAHIRHVDHLHHNSQHGHEGEQDESWSGACGLWCMPVELLQGRNQTSGKGQTQSLKVYGYHLQSSARCIDVISQQGKLYRAFPCLQIFACKSMATTCGQLTFQTKSVKVQCLKMYGYFCGQSGHQ